MDNAKISDKKQKLLKIAGLPLSPFYQYQLNLMEEIPIIISAKVYYDEDLKVIPYDERGTAAINVQGYFNMCYEHIKERKLTFPLGRGIAAGGTDMVSPAGGIQDI